LPSVRAASVRSSLPARVTLEVRRRFSAFALSPWIQYDAIGHVTAVGVPVYFLRSDKGSLNGGVRANWRSDTKAVTLSIFVGTVLGTVPGT
jgi:hypothetical protein